MATSPGVALLFLVIWLHVKTGLCKECTNTPSSSHTVRHAWLTAAANLSYSGSQPHGSFYTYPLYARSNADDTAHLRKEHAASGDILAINDILSQFHEHSFGDEDATVAKIQLLGAIQSDELTKANSKATELTSNPHAHRKALQQLDESLQAFLANRNKHARIGTSPSNPLAGGEAVKLDFGVVHQEPFLQEVSLHDVTLHPDSTQGRAQQTNLEYLLMLDVDDLVWSFRNTANLSTPGSPYGGWELPTSELRGHFVGHYLSATAQTWASTHNETIYNKMTVVVDALFECQQKIGTGYLSAFPSEFFDRFEEVRPVWAPYYTIHKIMAGLLDQYTLGKNSKALKMAIAMADYFNQRVLQVIDLYTVERHWQSLNEETGGMNDVLYRLYTITDDSKYLNLAHLFDKPCFLGLLAVQADGLSGFHANTHIPVVIGAQMRFEITGEGLYKDISSFFMDIVSSSHRYPTGGTSAGEFWTDPMHLGDTLFSTETEESCTTYNMLKVSRHLFRWTRQMKYADYYECALTNGVLSIQRGEEPGVMIYMLPMGKGNSKAISYHGWGTKFGSFWCCYGTGIESFSKLGDSIYFEETGATTPSLYIIQLVSSSFMWHTIGLLLNQRIEGPSSSNTTLHASFEFSEIDMSEEIATANGTLATLQIRVPFWVESFSGSASLNNETLNATLTPGEFLQVARSWQVGDKLELFLNVLLRTEKVKDNRDTYSSLHAIFFGPYLLAGLSTGDWEIKGVDLQSLSSWVTPLNDTSRQILFSFGNQNSSGHTSFLTHMHSILSMGTLPLKGSNEAISSTFQLVDPVAASLVSETCLKASYKGLVRIVAGPIKHLGGEGFSKDLMGKIVSIELFDQPGTFLMHKDMRKVEIRRANMRLGSSEGCGHVDSVFQIVPGLHFPQEYISFEAVSKPGCFLYAEEGRLRAVGLGCIAVNASEVFRRAASFSIHSPLASYHSTSFIAKGANKQYLLSPLMSLRDEFYTIFFNITS